MVVHALEQRVDSRGRAPQAIAERALDSGASRALFPRTLVRIVEFVDRQNLSISIDSRFRILDQIEHESRLDHRPCARSRAM